MKTFGENIEAAPSPLLPPDGSNLFKVSDPLGEVTGKFGAGETEWHSENLTEECIMELVRNKINNIEIDIENPTAAVDEIIEYLEERGIEISEDTKRYTEFAVSEKMNFLRDLKRLKINKDNPKEEERKPLREMAIKDAEWIEDVVRHIRENRSDPEKVERFWKEYDKTFLSFKEHEKNKNFTDKYNIKEGPEATKRGILAEIAAMDLLEKMINNSKMCKKVEIEYSTPEQDVYDKIDFFLIITLKNEKVIKIPVQVTSCDLSMPFTDPLDEKKKIKLDKKKEREKLNRKIKFVLGNTIHTNITIKDMEIDPNYPYQKRFENKMEKFFRINSDGISVLAPFGKVKDKEFDPVGGENTRKECIGKNGKPSRVLNNYFNKSPTIKGIETDLAQIAQ